VEVDFVDIGIDGLWAGLFAASIGILFSVPPRHSAGTFCCGAAGRIACDVLMSWGMNQNWATVIAAAVIVLVAVASVRGRVVSPVVLISGVLPIAAAVAMFDTVTGVMRISTLEGKALGAASLALSASASKAFTISLAIALGFGAGMLVVRVLKREEGVSA
jgi:uncharacterized membrane protein YjjB (DUF3815 family)